MRLADGASFEITKAEAGAGPSDGDRFVATLRKTDAVQVCYAPPQRFADAGPAARMAIAGIVRTGDYVIALAYPAKRAVAAPLPSRRPVALAAAIGKLAGTTIPVLVPSTFDGVGLSKGIFVVATHAADRYEMRFDYAPDCNGANVCSAGSFSGIRSAPPSTPGANERPVKLADGSLAYYSEGRSGASDGGNSRLRWSHGGVCYTIESRISSAAKLAETANSAIRNGPADVAGSK